MADEVKVSKVQNSKVKFVKFFKDIKGELKRVVWPNRSQLINNTVTVLVMCLLVGAIIWLADLGLGQLRQLVYGLK